MTNPTNLADMLNDPTLLCDRAYIDGMQVKLDDKQKELYKKYQEKYKID